MPLRVEMRRFGMLGAHGRADVRGASRQSGWAKLIMKSRSLRNRVERR